MKVIVGLGYYKDYNSIINELIKFENIKNEPFLIDKYQQLYLQWKNIKNKIDNL